MEGWPSTSDSGYSKELSATHPVSHRGYITLSSLPDCSSLFCQYTAQVTQGIILITPSFLGSLLGTQGAEQCTISLYFGHSPKHHQAHPNPPATLSISYFAQCGHLLERADSYTPCQVLLGIHVPAHLPISCFLNQKASGRRDLCSRV